MRRTRQQARHVRPLGIAIVFAVAPSCVGELGGAEASESKRASALELSDGTDVQGRGDRGPGDRPEPGAPAPPFLVDPPEALAVGDEYDEPSGSADCERTITADVVAIDQVLFFNRLGAFLPSGMIYALRRDVVPIDGDTLAAGNATLREDKRPRPLVLRMNVGDCLEVSFTNLLAPSRVNDNQPATRHASMLVNGLSWVDGASSSGAYVGENESSLAAPGETRVYRWYGSREGSFVFRSAGAMTGGEGDGGQPDHGLFGAVIVEPEGSAWYRSQITAEELDIATVRVEDGHRVLDYDAVYPAEHRFAGRPVLKMLDGTELFHGDLSAVIGDVSSNTYPPVTTAAPDNGDVERDRNEPFREFAVFYHDEQAMVQAFPQLEDSHTFHSVRDNMAINYGTAGVGGAILSAGPGSGELRNAVGSAAQCNDCKYEEFFLSSWTLGDPAMVVERDPSAESELFAAGAAVQALYPDDPANVFHSYLNDHVKFRVMHAGVAEHHIHHLHAHQWLHTANSDTSTVYDSQAIGPGSAYTLDIYQNGGGNRNKAPGDAIFHCHFYPHFAQGMWGLWRIHDVFEDGARTLPDAEIEGGTPIPALVPLPHLAMAPRPTAAMPGYPFYIPGVPGHRAPHPPLDTADDGGLPRHVVRGGTVEDGARGLFSRRHTTLDALAIPEEGTELEQAAMAFHAEREHESKTPLGDSAVFVTNGRPPKPGAPYADPCVDDDGSPADGSMRTIKAAVIQIDAIQNKAGWHFPQTRMSAHWADVKDFQSGARAPEPFFMRARSGDCIEFHLVNLAPGNYEQDDFQIYTPTDVIGQHIHLVKFDVTSSDGAANGWNYEDGSFAPEEVVERILAINEVGGLDDGSGSRTVLEPRAHPYFGVLGAQTTIQRWWADPVLNANGEDRTLRTVFTHDHFSPSTHQQAGLYAALLVEPASSTWRHPETGELLGGRWDGGPTSWRADILTADPSESYREFNLMLQDFALAYRADNTPVNPPGRREVALPHLVAPPLEPAPEAVSADDVGTFLVNYRNEPLALRLRDPRTNAATAGPGGDPAFAYSSSVGRRDPAFARQPSFYPPLTGGVGPLDPYTPLLRSYEGDRVVVQLLMGAHEEGHIASLHGTRWRHESSDDRSGYRNAETIGLSEHFELDTFQLPHLSRARLADHLYVANTSADGQWNGAWGLLRSYGTVQRDLLPLPSNPDGRLGGPELDAFSPEELVCPPDAPERRYDVTAVRAADALPGGTLVYNEGHGLHDPTALLYVLTEDLEENGRLRAGAPVEPLILRAAAGDCIRVTLRNGLSRAPQDLVGFNFWPMLVERFNANQLPPSSEVGLHPQLVHHDVTRHNGVNVGQNEVTTAGLRRTVSYTWYAGRVEVDDDGNLRATPVELGATNLMPADPLKHSNKGLGGVLVIEPHGAEWSFPEASTRATADVTYDGGAFREFVVVTQDDINLYGQNATPAFPLGEPIPPVGGGTVEQPSVEDSEDSANKALNYRTEPMWTRVGYPPGADLGATNDLFFDTALSATETGPIETPLFVAEAGTPVRFRLVQSGGHPRNHVFQLQGHIWRHEPSNPVSEIYAAQSGHGPGQHFDILPLHGAGGAMGAPGDYLYWNGASMLLDGGLWGIFRVVPKEEP